MVSSVGIESTSFHFVNFLFSISLGKSATSVNLIYTLLKKKPPRLVRSILVNDSSRVSELGIFLSQYVKRFMILIRFQSKGSNK
jgi:hypothetical protein